MKIEAEFELEKETKNTVRYQEKSAGKPPAIGTLPLHLMAHQLRAFHPQHGAL